MGRLTFPPSSRIYIDTAPLIYTTERHEDYASILEPLWESAKLGEIEVVTSDLTLLEVLVLPIRDKDDELIETYEQILNNAQIVLLGISTPIIREAARLRALQNFKTPDAIHAATALLSNCDYLVSNDTGFRRLAGIDVTILSDLV